jgi:hypothetical protein
MKYFIIEKDGKVLILETTKETHRSLKEKGVKVINLFGRKDYANIWCDFYNHKIHRKELRLKLKL